MSPHWRQRAAYLLALNQVNQLKPSHLTSRPRSVALVAAQLNDPVPPDQLLSLARYDLCGDRREELPAAAAVLVTIATGALKVQHLAPILHPPQAPSQPSGSATRLPPQRYFRHRLQHSIAVLCLQSPLTVTDLRQSGALFPLVKPTLLISRLMAPSSALCPPFVAEAAQSFPACVCSLCIAAILGSRRKSALLLSLQRLQTLVELHMQLRWFVPC